MNFVTGAKIPEQYFFQDDGVIPNSKLPVLVYREVFVGNSKHSAKIIEDKFYQNNWRGGWDNGIYSFHHYHSTAHEVLGIYSGEADVMFGGSKYGKVVKVKAGDVVVIPAGVGHKKISSKDLGVIGAYPNAMSYDLIKEDEPQKREQALKNLKKVPLPNTDPVSGENILPEIWNKIN